ncbi:hypothetical protein E1301_Tti009211 [Triplophysa tibetana]|uniref:Mitotic interactor and substrate of PLK1 n=1 Tax=Triplophysa tibetana TaxID=1572043 RepID=A0A5A9NXC2_9TELE|nr:hypothetical protein E1301_Tti009211 [Triplophysa tibetana]
METDLCPQRSESQDKCSNNDRDSQFTESRETPGEPEKQEEEVTCVIERVESPPQPEVAHTSSPADGAVEPNIDDLNSVSKVDQTQEWPPVPEHELATQTESVACQEGVDTNTETREDVLTHVQDAEGVQQEGCAVEHPLDSHDDSDVFLSENSEEQNTDCKPVAESIGNAQNIQQEALEPNKTTSLNENEAEQQVCDDAPPLDTVTGEPANPERESRAYSSTEDQEPLTGARRDGEREEGRERGDTGEERKQTGGAEEERHAGEAEAHSDAETERKDGKMDVDESQSDSGVSADFCPNSTTDASDCPANPESPKNETPIEREIRLALMREQNLRRARGLDDAPDRAKEFVEIPTRRPILSQDPKRSPSLDKDRQFAGKKMQMEICAEAEREKVLVDSGRLPGFYDKGMEVQVQEKKLLFESIQDPNGRSNSTSGEQAAAIQDFECSVDIKQRMMQFSQNPPSPPAAAEPEGWKSDPPVGPGLTESITAQVIIIETNTIFTPVSNSNGARETTSGTDGGSTADQKVSSSEPVGTTRQQSFEDDQSLVKENPFFKLRSSAMLPQVEQDIKEAKERERELQVQRSSVYGGAAVEPEAERKGMEIGEPTQIDSGMGGREKIERRVEEEIISPSEEILSPSAKETNLNLTACQAEASTTPTSGESLETPPSRVTPVVLCVCVRKMRFMMDDSKKLTVKASRTPRQRNPLLDRWESGMVNGLVEDSN